MYSRCKYVIGEIRMAGGLGVHTAILFGETLGHADVRSLFIPDSIISAGFVNISTDGQKVTVHPYGESVGLKVKSRGEEDVRLIKQAIAHPDTMV